MTSRVIRLARIALLVVLAFVLVGHAVHNRADYVFISELDWRYLLPIALFGIVRMFLEAVRYSATAHAAQRYLPLRHAFVYLIVARLFDKLLPQSGLAYKARMLQKAGDADTKDILSIFGSMIWMQVFFTLMAAAVLVSILHPDLEIGGILAVTALVVLLLLQLAGTFFVSAVVSRSTKLRPGASGAWSRLLNRLIGHVDSLLALLNRPWLLTVSALTILASTLVSVLRLYLCFRMLGVAVDVAVVMVFVAVNRLVTMFVITPGNLGVTEILYGQLSQELGIGMAQGVIAALVIRLVMIAVLTAAGFLLFMFARRMVTGEDSFEAIGPETGRTTNGRDF